MRLSVDGVVRGSGAASKVEQARREAARQTFIAMGWVTPTANNEEMRDGFIDSDDGSDTVMA